MDPQINIFLLECCAGAIIGAIFTKLLEYAINLKNLRVALQYVPGDIYGTWYSSEYDIKYSTSDRNKKIAHTEVKIRRNLRGYIVIDVIKYLDDDSRSRKTMWQVRGKMIRDTLAGTWHSKTEGTIRHGVCMIQFLDNAIAAGHYIGIGHPHLVYGYWIMSRDMHTAYNIADIILDKYEYVSFDTGLIAAMHDIKDIKKKDIIV